MLRGLFSMAMQKSPQARRESSEKSFSGKDSSRQKVQRQPWHARAPVLNVERNRIQEQTPWQ
ncbi:hypothetical protein [Pantoea sp. 18069]|uniref:hypothetical protein n=1 Tax=Pantoea sp. 18069 TaxID=2681415 RepID=UPI001358FE4C|nr:hypothetical protein [Pantoea sp. 18069]